MNSNLNPQHLDCVRVMSMMDQYIDCELEAPVVQAIETHIDVCQKCQAHADIEFALKSSIQRCCQSEVAPEAVRARVVNALATSKLEWISTVVVTQTISIEIREIDN